MWPYDPTIHLVLFIHRVTGIAPGVYFLLRNKDPDILRTVQELTDSRFLWELIPNGNAETFIPLYLLESAIDSSFSLSSSHRKGDARHVARVLSCDQEIASDGAFSLGMIAEFDDQIKERGAWWYPRIFWFV
jgi:hypothetical protein